MLLSHNSPQRTQNSQSAAIFPRWYEVQQRHRTRMTQIGRIFTDTFNPRASVSTVTPVDCVHTYASALAYVDMLSVKSVFNRNPFGVSAFIGYHLRQINRAAREALAG